MFCKKCGNKLNEDSQFCRKCGTNVNADTAENNYTQGEATENYVPSQPKYTPNMNNAKKPFTFKNMPIIWKVVGGIASAIVLTLGIVFVVNIINSASGGNKNTVELTSENFLDYFVITYGYQTSGSHDVTYTINCEKKKDFNPNDVKFTVKCLYKDADGEQSRKYINRSTV